jgi:hydroxymethylpyrimidine pyrophosphatase-like HAD family hydrolase
MFEKLICFDFDGTLIHTPTPETTGLDWQGRGWWGNPESLNTKIFYPPVNQWVYNHFLDYQSDPDNYVFIATGRLKRLENHVQKVLDLHDIKCDLFCNTGGETFNFKKYLFEQIILKNPKAEEFIMYDDRHEHLDKFVEWGKYQKIKVTIIDVINKKQLL